MQEIKLEPRERCCCITGHRPEKWALRDAPTPGVAYAISQAMNEGFTTFITGGAKGVDLVAAEEVLELRERLNGLLKLVVALPYPTFGGRLDPFWKQSFERAIQEADLVVTLAPECSRSVYQARNRWMVDHSSLVLALYNGAPGGTRNTLRYARRQGVAVRVLDAWEIEPENDALAELVNRYWDQ